MLISILTLFPEMFAGPFDFSILKRAQLQQKVKINLINIRDFAKDSYGTVDDHPYGGGVGMILKVDLIHEAINYAKKQAGLAGVEQNTKIILLEAFGTPYIQKTARSYSTLDHLIIICGHYEGVDARVEQLCDDVISIGDYIVTGGELPAMVIVDSVVRLLPGVLEKPNATYDESFENDSLSAPQFTRPPSYEGMDVPQVLTQGDHKKIAEWKKQSSEERKNLQARQNPIKEQRG